MTHAIGRGIVDLIQKHEPRAIGIGAASSQEARDRVLRDLGDSIGGLLAFTIAFTQSTWNVRLLSSFRSRNFGATLLSVTLSAYADFSAASCSRNSPDATRPL